jgi:excisionase family DNA binding protein
MCFGINARTLFPGDLAIRTGIVALMIHRHSFRVRPSGCLRFLVSSHYPLFPRNGQLHSKRNGTGVAQLTSPMENNTDPLSILTIRETADVLQVSLRTALRMAKSKQLPAFKLGGQWRIRESELAKWLEGLNER